MERTVDWIAAALAVMRCGAAYVPLDQAWPETRLLFAIEDSGATALIARRSLSRRLHTSACSIDLTFDLAEIQSLPEFQPVVYGMNNLAYVIYTSGSTGVPKGVEVTHANLANLVRWHQRAFSVSSRDRASHLAGLGFDASVWEIWPNLCAGATVCIAGEETRSSPKKIHDWLLRQRVTIAFIPTFYITPLTKMPWPEASALRWMLTGGDKLHEAPQSPLPFKLVNNYGPAECTVVATSGLVTPGQTDTPSVGRSIDGAYVYVLDESMRPVDDGVVGEIYIGGSGVANGYRNLPQLTMERFLPDPFLKKPNARMYRTGDFGVQNPDGEIEFRGRRDRQIKLRGQRIELDEIDSVLNRHCAVKFAITVLDDREGKPQLMTYVLPFEEAAGLTSDELQKDLQRSLPAYMIPTFFLRLESFPATTNGKVDLASLPAPQHAQRLAVSISSTGASYLEPALLAIVRELLEDPEVKASDNFFLAGGHSLLGMQLILRLQSVFGVELSLQDLFRSPTVEHLAAMVDKNLSAQAIARLWQHQLGVAKIGIDENLYSCGADVQSFLIVLERVVTQFRRKISAVQFLSASTIRVQTDLIHGGPVKMDFPAGVLEVLPKAGRRIIFWIHYQNVELAKAIGDDMTFLSVVLTPADLTSLGQAPTLQQVARCLVPKILETQSEGPYVVGGLCIGGVLAYEVACQLESEGKHVSLLVLLDPPTPAYLKLGPSPTVNLSYVRYLIQRAMRLGLKVSVKYFQERLARRIALIRKKEPLRTISTAAQVIIESAAFNYLPAKYGGNVLLLLASERPPSVNFLPGWQAVTTAGLNAQYVNAHHRDLLGAKSVQEIADAIKSRLSLKPRE